MSSETSIVIKKARLSFPSLWQPSDYNGDGNMKYRATLLIPKTDKATLVIVQAAIDAVAATMPKVKGKVPTFASPLKDGDQKEYDGYEGMWYLTCANAEQPSIVRKVAGKVEPLTEKRDIYAGCFVAANINFYTSKTFGGVHISINSILKVADGEAFGEARMSVEDAFGDVEVVEDDVAGLLD